MVRVKRSRIFILKYSVLIFLSFCAVLGVYRLTKHNDHTEDIGSLSKVLGNRGNIKYLKNPKIIFPSIVSTENDTEKANDMFKKTDTAATTIKAPINKMNDQEAQKKKSIVNRFGFNIDLNTSAEPNYNVHVFYYPWYGNPEHDGKFLHWNHAIIEHWNKQEALKWPKGMHSPPDNVGANYYPLLGAYSSKDPEVVDIHMQMLRYAGIGVVVVSWYPSGDADNEGLEPDSLVPLLLDAAQKYSLKVALHVEPFKERDDITMREQLKYIISKYGSHPAFYRTSHKNKVNLPLIYIYDSYLIGADKWKNIFTEGGSLSVRGTEFDAIFIGLLVENKHLNHVIASGFDGVYTYFATNGFTYGSTWTNWLQVKKWAESHGLLFIPSVGPGYIDTEIRPWNAMNTRKRLGGKYYSESVQNALAVHPDIISITSFNEWHEGTQIEPAIRKSFLSRSYEDYEPQGPMFYLNATRNWVDTFRRAS
ncbi:glycoprotein endo-alpha-1,2-mannosidase-like isoform X1 [Dreissena polymorpha]|nr:glycoprotein endo-alpha-1,2-mannosidase-like isoform X1 [Dreissena polymorpha]XP_052243733.1 glycoprotein endo-alpha-1,2-mannosidase-like isoform X1 [Dreissena polymorpha]XP_052243734.1 glycoprotein endo-alpha-1,2-mannosidase-like isoform X1 [Dreissena polymorpha]XP_052243735.1 glycoprotein endo-alpha-1,2-mannosidase-like isoform X1 [Dreissena polymorpha]